MRGDKRMKQAAYTSDSKPARLPEVKKKKKKNVYFDRMFLVRRPTIKAYNEAASMQVT